MAFSSRANALILLLPALIIVVINAASLQKESVKKSLVNRALLSSRVGRDGVQQEWGFVKSWFSPPSPPTPPPTRRPTPFPTAAPTNSLVASATLSSLPQNFAVASYDWLIRISVSQCNGRDFTYLLKGTRGSVQFEVDLAPKANDATLLFLKSPRGISDIGTLREVHVHVEKINGRSCTIDEIAVRRAISSKWFTTWHIPASSGDVSDSGSKDRAAKFQRWKAAARARPLPELDDDSPEHEHADDDDDSWWPSWLSFGGSDSDEEKVDEFADTLSQSDQDEGCWWFCDWFPALAGTKEEAKKSVGPTTPVAVLDAGHRDSAPQPFNEAFTCGMASSFHGVKFSVSNVLDFLQMRPTTFEVPPHCAKLDIPKLLDLESEWLNPLTSISAYDVVAKNAAFGRIDFSFRPQSFNAATGRAQGRVISFRAFDVRMDASGEAVFEANNPIRDRVCESAGCGKNSFRGAFCSLMDCADVGIESILRAQARVNTIRTGGLDISADITLTMNGKGSDPEDADLNIATNMAGLDDSISWQLNSEFLSKIAQATKSAMDNFSDVLNFVSINTSDLEKVVKLLDSVGIDEDHSRNEVSVSDFLAAVGSTSIGGFVHKTAGDDLDTIHDIIKKIKIPKMPRDASCHPESVQEEDIEFGAHTLQELLTHEPATFSIPPICKSLSEETKGWLRSFALWDFGIESLGVRKVDFGIAPPNTAENPSVSTVLISTAVSGIKGTVTAAFMVDAWGLGKVQGRVTVELDGYEVEMAVPVQHHSVASADAARLPKEGRVCKLSDNEDAISIDFDIDGLFLGGIFDVAEHAISYFIRSHHLVDLICAKAIPSKLADLVEAFD